MRVAFVSGNRELLPDAAIPIGILSVIANLPKRHETTLIDLCFEDAPADTLAQGLDAFGPDMVALGMRNIQNADYSGTSNTLEYYDGLIGVIRNATEVPITIGGSGFSVMPVELMKRLQPDFGISGRFPLCSTVWRPAWVSTRSATCIGSKTGASSRTAQRRASST